MRTGLIPHLGQQVLCKGWIASWKDLEGLSTRQVVVKNPTIRKADRKLRFEQQTLLTKEDHLNLFISTRTSPTTTQPSNSMRRLVLWSGSGPEVRRIH